MNFDAEAATAAYIDSLGAEALARSAAYTSGNHWLMLWGFLVTVIVAWIVIRSGVLTRLDQRLARRGPNLRAFVISAVYLALAAVLTLPWSMYADWWRERSYGRSSQPLADALGQGLLQLVVAMLLGGLFFMGVYALLRRTGKRWWLWSAGFAAAFMSAILLVAPVAIQPLFNDYRPVPEGQVRSALLDMAAQAGIPPERIVVYDGSRQSNNFTANVSGLGPYKRIAISDVAFKGASIDEVKAVTAHEIGHYTLAHVWQRIAFFSLVVMLTFYVADRMYPRTAAALGSRAPLASPTSVPVLMVLISLLTLLATPLFNAYSRYAEHEADQYSLQTVNLPDALASALVKTAEYRYPRPGAIQEAIFYTHPSVERRVRAAMHWKAAQLAKTGG